MTIQKQHSVNALKKGWIQLILLDYKYDTFQYDLEKVDGKWKVSSQTKDMAMPDLGDMGLGDEDMMEDMPMEESVMTDEDHDHDGHDHDHEH